MKNPKNIIESLNPFVTERRKERIKNVLDYRLSSIYLAMECPSDINNALAAIRTAEALGIDTVHIINPEGGAAATRAVTQGAIYWVNVAYHDSLDDFLCWGQVRGQTPEGSDPYLLAGAKMDGKKALSDVPVDKPLCLLLGNESRGLSKSAINACDITYHIPMCGMSESLNLSVSAAISLYDTTQRKRALLKSSGDLSETDYATRLARAYLQSVPKRLAEKLFNDEVLMDFSSHHSI